MIFKWRIGLTLVVTSICLSILQPMAHGQEDPRSIIKTCVLWPIYDLGSAFLYYAEYHEYPEGAPYNCSNGLPVYAIGEYAWPQDCANDECLAETITGGGEIDPRRHLTQEIFVGFPEPHQADFELPELPGTTIVQERFVRYTFSLDNESKEFKAKVFTVFVDPTAVGKGEMAGRLLRIAIHIEKFPGNGERIWNVPDPTVRLCRGDYAYSLEYPGHKVLLLTSK